MTSVESFWSVYNNIVKASKLAAGSNYHLFKKGVRPEWEDAQNAKGGKWVLQIPRSKRDTLDDWWLFTVLFIFSQQKSGQGEEGMSGVQG